MYCKLAICDDNAEYAQFISGLVAQWAKQAGIEAHTALVPSAEAFHFQYEEERDFDILLLDVEMGGMDGVELAKRVRREDDAVQIVFITGYTDYIAEGYEVSALHYLTKPVSGEKLMEVLNRAAERLSLEPPFVIITCDSETIKLYESEILYIESFLHYISIHTAEKEYKLKENISSFQQKLSDDFYRLHRSDRVSLNQIRRISRTLVTLQGETELPLARGKYDDINRAFVARN